MLRFLTFTLLGLFVAIVPARSAPLSVDDPDKFSNDIFLMIQKAQFQQAALTISQTLDKKEFAQTLENALKILDGKKFDFGKKVLDKDYSGALRLIVQYSYIENLGFIYFKYVFEMSSKGWILAAFSFKDSPQDLFPKDMLEVLP